MTMQVSSSITTTPPERASTSRRDGIEIHRDIALVGLQDRAGRSAGNHGLQLFPATHAAPTSLIMRMRLKPWAFIDAGFVDMTGKAEQPRATVLR